MSTSRPPKWDWTSHQSKMIELYNTQLSIPDIYKAIQCEGFEPCQRSVYAKFKSMGYPTDPVGRSRLLDARLALIPKTEDSLVDNQLQSSISYTSNMQSLCPLPEDQMLMDIGDGWGSGFDINSPASNQLFEYTDINNALQSGESYSRPSRSAMGDSTGEMQGMKSASEVPSTIWSPAPSTTSQNIGPVSTNYDQPFDFDCASMEINGGDYFGIDTSSYNPHIALPGGNDIGMNGKSPGAQWQSGIASGSGCLSMNSSHMDLDDAFSIQDDFAQQPRRSGSIDIKSPFQNFINPPTNTGTRKKLRSLFRTKSGGSIRSGKKYAASQYTNNTQDSGYASGFGSCLTLEDVRQINSQSLREFNGLYRVACHNLHEPQAKAQCKDIVTCSYCKYASIHNLGWSSRYLKLEVFLSELLLDEVYDFKAIDASGNTALHYAAAGGAGFRHLKALIDVGVDPYAVNTSGELFIYCLRPIQPFTLEPNSDCLKSDDLISLLGLLAPERVFDWRDNDGQTVLHALCSKITEVELRRKIIEIFKAAGYPPTVRDRFGRTAEDVTPLTYDCHGQVIETIPEETEPPMTHEAHSALTCEDLRTADWKTQQLNQIRDQNILTEARKLSTYRDPEMDDNALHAISRLRSSNDTLLALVHFNTNDPNPKPHNREGNRILSNLEYLIPQGIDLNLHNRQGDFPLKAFICNRPWEEKETGATMSKYIDAILWKDLKKRISNNVNVNMKDREGSTALHLAAVRGQTDSVRSLIEAGGNGNARSDNGISVLQATYNSLSAATKVGDGILIHLLKEVISHLEHGGAVLDPKSIQERGLVH